MSDSTTAVAKREGVLSIGERAREAFNGEQVRLIKATVAKDCSDAELGYFLEMAARYELDPFAKEIYAAKMSGKNGGSGSVAIIVARDGLLKIAGRTGEFEGIEGDVVREKDEFRKQSGVALPEHSYGGNPKLRGPIVGAWCTAYRHGRKPTYFFAPLEEYRPTGRKLEFSPWGAQESAMILKCAEAMALRKAFSITGVIGEEEMSRALIQEVEAASEIDWGSEPTLQAWLPQLFEAANQAREGSYRAAKIRMLLAGKTDDEREKVALDLVDQIGKWGGAAPVRPTVEQLAERGAANPEEIVQDAEIVGEDDADYVPSDPEADIPFGPDEAPLADDPS